MTEPLRKDGEVDFFEFLNRKYSAGVTVENNANVLLWRVLGPTPGSGRQPEAFFERLGIQRPDDEAVIFRQPENFPNWDDGTKSKPWKRSDIPELAEWLDSIDEPLRVLVEATERPVYFTPVVRDGDGDLFEVLLPGVQYSREFARALLSRAMLKLGEGNRLDAWRDLMAAHRLGRHIGRGPFVIDSLVGIAIEALALEGELKLLSETQPSSKFVALYRKQLDRLPPRGPVAERINIAERVGLLDACQSAARGKRSLLEVSDIRCPPGLEGEFIQFAEKALFRAADWDEVFRSINLWFDRVDRICQLPPYQERQKQLKILDDELKRLAQQRHHPFAGLVILADRPQQTEFLANTIIANYLPACWSCLRAEARSMQRFTNLEISLALVAFRSDNGSFPESLDALSPKYLKEVPLDVFTNQPLRYRRVNDGYVLYSLGPNGRDEDGRGEGVGEAGDQLDDLTVRMSVPVVTRE